MQAEQAQARLIEALLDPVRYPHPVERVERIDTHISTVLLAGDFAYKIKKPLRLDFLDFSSLEKRAFFCAEEVRLNRRAAPDLYLGRVPITGDLANPAINGAGAPIEYAVQMRRFPPGALLSELLSVSGLPLPLMDELARVIVGFHASAEVAALNTGFGLPKRVEQPVRDTLDTLSRIRGADRVLGSLRSWANTLMPALEPVFEARRHAGFVRECHGDMHLGNIVRWHGRIVPFDAIEFDPELRWIDTMNDLAFPLMDLDHRGACAHGYRLRNVYLEASGDYAGLQVLRFYQAYRALVRAKIAAIWSAQLPKHGERYAALERETDDYLQLAAAYAQPTQPCVVLTCGLSGSGKTSVAQALVESYGFVRVRSDVERKRLFGLDADAPSGSALGEGIYQPDANARTYSQLLRLTQDCTESGVPVVVDATFLRYEQRAPFLTFARERGIPAVLLRVEAPLELLRERIRRRLEIGTDASEADLAVLEQQQLRAEWPQPEEGDLLCVNTARPDWPERLGETFGRHRFAATPMQ